MEKHVSLPIESIAITDLPRRAITNKLAFSESVDIFAADSETDRTIDNTALQDTLIRDDDCGGQMFSTYDD
jgi:hypothetical protein